MNKGDIVEARKLMISAMAEYDRLGHDKFAAQYPRAVGENGAKRFSPPKSRPLVFDGQLYPAKAILKAAWSLADKAKCKKLLQTYDDPFARVMQLGFDVGNVQSGVPDDIPATSPEEISEAENMATGEIEALLEEFLQPPPYIKKKAQVFKRSAKVRAICLKRANWNCERCGQEGFEKANGVKYLEVHHLQGLSENGLDHPKNCIALCADCHRRAHYSADAEAIGKKMMVIASEKHTEMMKAYRERVLSGGTSPQREMLPGSCLMDPISLMPSILPHGSR